MKKEQRHSPPIAPMAPVLLLAITLALALLALFQWLELFIVHSGGQALCNINQIVNCEAVWSSPLASRIHRFTGMPVAALGLVWATTAFALSALLVHHLVAASPLRIPVVALRLMAAVAILVCIMLGVGSIKAGAACLTCVGTFALVLAFTWVVARLLPGPLAATRAELRSAAGWCLALGAAAYLVALGPGLATPKTSAVTLSQNLQESRATDDDWVRRLREFLTKLPHEEQQAFSDALAVYQRSSPGDPRQFGVRNRHGPISAPVKFVEFTDIRCSHCAELIQVMKEIERVVPQGRTAIEARNFPLDHSCNPMLQGTDESGVRCLGAKVLICLERTADFWSLREKLFAEQQSLNPERLWEIASSGSMKRPELEACVASASTNQLLKEDIEYALRYSPKGTPLVLINGREAPFIPSFLFAMAMTGGNPRSPAFDVLPPPRTGLP